MSLYIAQKINSNNQAHAVFSFRGIKGYTQATPSSLHITGQPSVREPAYSGYRDNIDVFILANNHGKSIRLDSEGGLCIMKGFLPIPIGPLIFSINPALKLSDDEENRLLAQLGSATKERSGRVTKYTIPEVSWSLFGKIQKFANFDFGTGRKELSIRGAELAFTMSGLVYEFLATNSYAAFRGDNEMDGGSLTYGEIRTLHVANGGLGYDKYGLKAVQASTSIARKRIKYSQMAEEMLKDAEREEIKAWDDVKNIRTVGTENARDVVWVAHPKRGSAESNFGPVASIPPMPGLIFPYFPGMNAPDPLTFKSSITLFFLRCLGENLDTSKKRMAELRSGASNLSNTDTGMALAHVLTGMRLCLETQSRLYVIIESGQYRGFALLGWHFAVYDGSRWVDAVPYSDLKEQMFMFDTHSSNLEYICDELSAMSVNGEEDIVSVDHEKIKTGYQLIEQIRRRKIECTDREEEKLNLALRGLYFGEPYATPSHDNIQLLVNALIQGEMPAIDSATYLYQIRADYSDVTYRNLLCFGPEAPVPIGHSGSEYSIPEPKKDDPIFSPKEGKPVDALVFYMKPPHVAKLDWVGLGKKRVVKMNVKERAGPHRAIFFKEPKTRQVVWDLVRTYAWMKRQVEDKEIPVAKRPKVASAAEIFDLF